jgi:hypothetical protein
MPQPNDLSRSLVALDQNSTIIAVIEMSQSSWLVAGMLPGIERQPRKKLEPNPERLLGLLHRWQDEAVRAGRGERVDTGRAKDQLLGAPERHPLPAVRIDRGLRRRAQDHHGRRGRADHRRDDRVFDRRKRQYR